MLSEKAFCCEGCKTVFQILHTHEMETYYELEAHPGANQQAGGRADRFAYLDLPEVQDGLLDYRDEHSSRLRLLIPQIHCSSCIWLLENLHRLHPAIQQSRVQFLKKELTVVFAHSEFSLRELVELLSKIGYTPELNLNDLNPDNQQVHTPNSFYYKLGIAGFAFGNIMLLSFPEYLGLDAGIELQYSQLFGYLNLLLALPVFFYSASDYFRSAWFGMKHGNINIDLPISIGVITLFLRSSFEVLSHTGAGYFDSMAGLVFLLLVGKWFQHKTYNAFSFERDYESYFPIAVTQIQNGIENSIPVKQVAPGDMLLVRNGELIPADSLLISDEAAIDYSFVTGEARPVQKSSGELIYAGGRQTGGAIRVQVRKEISQSYLTQLWNQEEGGTTSPANMATAADQLGRYFTVAILLIATVSAVYWGIMSGFPMAMNVFTAIMIIACPCAIALTIPFTLGNSLRILGRMKCYIKNTHVIERMAKIDHIVFDKTGTLTYPAAHTLEYHGVRLSETERSTLHALASQSTHPVSRSIAAWAENDTTCPVHLFNEVSGKGISGYAEGKLFKVGSGSFVWDQASDELETNESGAYLAIDGAVKGQFIIPNEYREGLPDMIQELQNRYSLSVLSGDNAGERARLAHLFSANTPAHFNQSPQEKLTHIQSLQNQGQQVLMVGDGLNDAGALRQSEVGIAVSEHINNFSPASDIILDASVLPRLGDILTYARTSMRLVRYGFFLSLLYNLVGLGFAIQGLLSPLVAAILMPLSSITILLFAIAATRLSSRQLFHPQSTSAL